MQIHFKNLFTAFCTMLSLSAMAQNSTVSGEVRDALSGESLIGVVVSVAGKPAVGAVTNAYGFYSLSVPAGETQLVARYIGYKADTQRVKVNGAIRVNFNLIPEGKQLAAVEVTGEKGNENLTKPTMGTTKLDMKEVAAIPVLMGEKDILKTIQLLPGVKSAGEGNAGFYVRGGGPDQNLILLDEATVYNASHLLGFFSTFNSDALKDVTLHKGGMPAEYGGRLASVLDVRMRDGNDKRFGADGGIGAISSRLTIDGPLVKDKGSFIVSGRRTYADVFLRLSNDSNLNQSILYFYDLNAKLNYRINDNNRIFVSGYFGRDIFGFGEALKFDWGNATGTIRWNHIFNEKLFSNTSIIYSNYDYAIDQTFGSNQIGIKSNIRDWNFKQDFHYFPRNGMALKAGLNVNYHTFLPGKVTVGEASSFNPLELDLQYALESAVYLQNEHQVNERFSMNYGIRISMFNVLGNGNVYTYDANGEVTDTTSYRKGEIVKTYYGIEPRLSMSYLLNEKNSVKVSYNRTQQYIHQLSNTTTTFPTDLWIPSSVNVKPQMGDQIAAGWFSNFKENSYEFSTEVYYKNLTNQIDYRNGAQLILNENVEGELLSGKGRAYGVELLLRKRKGKFTGWVGYTLSRTERKFEGINKTNWFPARQDRTHDVSLVGIYQLSEKWTFSAAFVFYTGNAVTFPSGSYVVDGNVVPYYTERNAYRMPDYHRLDLGATFYPKKKNKRWKNYESNWNFSVYNAYGRENAFAIQFRQDPDDASRMQAVQITLFRWIPSVTYNFKF
ncbi:MAG: TonB-dependent receptor [Bacteroidetes bacterium]|nr:TonB-dependent receptor [Bacteroidota bacterium]